MLDVIENYPFCSIANQQAILILDILKKAISLDELEMLKQFIESNLSNEQTIRIRFDSGNQCNSGNLATLIKMGLALKEITADLQPIDDSNSQQHWNRFCNGPLKKYEIKWTRKLEDYNNGKLEDEQEEIQEEGSHDDQQPFQFKLTGKQIADNASRRYNNLQESENHEQMLGNMLEANSFKEKVQNLKNRGKKSDEEVKKALQQSEEEENQAD